MEYRARVDLPEMMKTFIQEIQGVGAVTGITDQYLTVTFEAEDPYDLGVEVTNLQHTLESVAAEIISITKPTEVKGEGSSQPV